MKSIVKPWNVDVGDVELLDGEVDGVQIVPGGAADWSGVRDLSGVSPLCNSVKSKITICNIMLKQPGKLLEDKNISHFWMKA